MSKKAIDLTRASTEVLKKRYEQTRNKAERAHIAKELRRRWTKRHGRWAKSKRGHR